MANGHQSYLFTDYSNNAPCVAYMRLFGFVKAIHYWMPTASFAIEIHEALFN